VVVEALPSAEREWLLECERVADGSLFKETASWIFGNNVAGKKVALRFYFGGLAKYHRVVRDVVADNFRGLKPLAPTSEQTPPQLQMHETAPADNTLVDGARVETAVLT